MKRAARITALAAGIFAGASLTSAGCAGPGDDLSTITADGSLRGELAEYISDDPELGSQTHYFLKDAAGHEQRLLFDSAPGLEPGAPIKVWGTSEGTALRVTSFERLPPAASATESSALINATPYAPRKFAFILLDIGAGINRTADDAMARMITAPDSIRNYYLSDSYGMQDIMSVVVGPFTYTPSGCDTGAMASALRAQVDAMGGPFQHYLWYYGSKNSSCSWSGLASVGMPDRPSKDTWYNASTSCVVLVQEPGHNFGMQHSSSLACGTSAAFADDPNTCTASEYGDVFDPMGGGCRHMNAWQKAYQGWFGGCNGVKVTNSGTFTLVPYEMSCTGVQFLQVKAPKTRTFNRPAAGGGGATTETMNFYYLELRTPLDFDGTLGNSSALSARVLVHVADDLRTRTQRGAYPFLLDMTPTTTGRSGMNDAGLAVGQTFTDPGGGLTITAQAISNSSATIVVTYTAGSGGPTCLDGSAFTAPGPGMESCVVTPTGNGGASGTAGTTGTAGAGGRGGTGGTTGGRGGSTGGSTGGAAGRGGSSGTAGTTGTAGNGMAGIPGTAGRAGDSGAAGTTGAGGSITPAGTAGTTGSGGGKPPGDRGVSGGCACDAAGEPGSTTLATLLMFAGVVLAAAARRPRRRLSRVR